MSSRALNMELARLQAKDPTGWTVSEVGMWLDFIECSDYKIAFIENSISGSELFDLEDEDLVAIGVKKLGHRKKILQKIKDLRGNVRGAFDVFDKASAHSEEEERSSNTGSMQHSSSTSTPSEISVKCYYGDEIRVIRMRVDAQLRQLKRKIKNEFGASVSIKWKDNDGDIIPIRKDRHWRSAVAASGNTIRLQLTEKKRALVSATETSVLENLVDGVVIIDPKGVVQFMNRSAERMFGYDRSEVLNRNVNMLMPPEFAQNHDRYLSSYLQTGVAKIIGTGRRVTGKRKNGTTFPLHLSLSEAKSSSRHTFTGTIQDLSGREDYGRPTVSNDAGAQFAILENILDASIVIDEKGIVQFFNRRSSQLFGYSSAEVVGRNIKMLMPSPYAEHHDGYLLHYLQTGHAKIIGIGRDVITQCKDGSLMPTNLSVTEHKLSDTRRHFTGILRRIEEEKQTEKSILQQEREVLDNLVVPAIVIDEKGVIHGFNKASQDMFGYTLIDVVGKNIKMLMASPDREHHDRYLADYIRTGKSRVIGVGRDVIAQSKSGTMMGVRLSVTERRDGPKRIFTGVLQKL